MTTVEHPMPGDAQEMLRPEPAKTPRLWPGIVLVAAYWAFVLGFGRLDMPIFAVFMSGMAASLLLLLAFSAWWLLNRRIARGERWWSFLALVAGLTIAGFLSDPSVGPMGLAFVGVPVIFTAWVVWLVVARRLSSPVRRWGTVGVLAAVLTVFSLSRVDGVDGQSRAAVSWRWSPTEEDRYLSERAERNKSADAANLPSDVALEALVSGAGDWPEFRGPDRLGEVRGVRIATDWNDAPPEVLWKRRIGPAWSSVLVIGNRLFTQEQRGEKEAVVCLDPATGREIWSHEDAARFSDGQAGAGPRATPTFSDGQIYSLGGTGVLNCLEAASGKLKWTRNIAADSGAPLPMWGFSSSPLVTDGIVVVYAGGPGDKGLLAYRAADGSPAWTVATGPSSYSSPQRASFGGESQILFLSDAGLVAVEPATGSLRWRYDAAGAGTWRVIQPRQLDPASLLIGSEDLGLVRLELTQADQSWTSAARYRSRALRAAYNDFVVVDGFAYGFDESIFCCVDVETGKRRWKAGRYGHGQVLLIADQPLLLVVSETGEAVLVGVSPDKHEELGRFQAVEGKTWNHPVIAYGRLFVRNSDEMACYTLKLAEGP